MIEIKNIDKKLGQFSLNNINLSIKENEYFVILGPTGTGKTVLLELIAGLQKADGGGIFYNGKKIDEIPPEERDISMVYQDYMLFPHLDVRENISFGLKVRGYSKDEIDREVREIVELFKIKDLLKRNVKTLSGGEQQRIALARALVISPAVLLLDEPLSALDPGTQEKFQYDLKKIHEKLGTITVHVTHDFNESLIMADRIAIMNNGKIIQQGQPREVFQQPKSNFIAGFVGAKNIFAGKIYENDKGDKLVKIDDNISFCVITEKKGKVNLSIRPEDILISYSQIDSTARNCFQGQVVDIQNKLSVVEVSVDIAIVLNIYITRHSLEDMEIEQGKDVYITFKASAVHVF